MKIQGLAIACAILAAALLSPAARAAVIITIDPDTTLTGNASGSAVNPDGSANKPADDHAKEYDGPTQFVATYTINLKDGVFDPDGSSVQFTTVYYTSKGHKTPSGFKTEVIPITSAILNPDNSVAYFAFEATDWYPDAAKSHIQNKGIKGYVDLTDGGWSFTSAYLGERTGAIFTYVVGGGAPEPATWGLMILGFGLAGLALRRGRVRAAGPW